MTQRPDPVALAIVGPGRMGMLYGRIANQLALTRLVAITGEGEAQTRESAEALGVPGYSGGAHGEMLARHPEIEAVLVATPEWSHVEPVLAALQAGKHVLVEKPLAVSPEDARRIAAAAQAAGTTAMVCHSQRFNPRFALMRQAAAAGEVGRVMHLYARRHSLQPAVDRVLGRCPLAYWLAPHDIDMMLWTAGSRALAVRAWSGAGGVARSDFIGATIRFESGATGVLETSWCTPGISGRPLNELFTVRGDAGSIEVVGAEQGLAIYRQSDALYPDTYQAPAIHGQIEGPYRSLLRHFAGAVRELWPPLMAMNDGVAVIEVAHALDRSLSSGDEVAVACARGESCRENKESI